MRCPRSTILWRASCAGASAGKPLPHRRRKTAGTPDLDHPVGERPRMQRRTCICLTDLASAEIDLELLALIDNARDARTHHDRQADIERLANKDGIAGF